MTTQFRSFYIDKDEAEQMVPYVEFMAENGPNEFKSYCQTLSSKLKRVRATGPDFPLRGEQVPLTLGEARVLEMVTNAMGLPDMSHP